ncbi:TPA: Protein kinase, membrane associated tyrosine threonine 1 [Trebouxia sp. C0005]
MASDKVKFQEGTTGDIGQFGMFPEGRVSVEAVHRKFDAKVVEVELSPGTDHGFSVLEAGIDGYSLDAFKPASEHTYTIRVTPNIATGLTRPGPQDSGSLRQKLASVKPYVDEKVVLQMIQFFAAQIPYADEQHLGRLYDAAKASPLTSTKAILKTNADIVFNGAFSGGMPSRAMLLIGFHRGTQPVVCKFTLEDADVLHEHQVLTYLLSVPALTGIVNPVELVTFKSGAQVAAPNEAAMSVKHCLKMPLYPSTLQHLPVPMDAPVVLACGKQLESTLKQIHNAGYGHNDVKAANVFISASGDCILGDFGSALTLGRRAREDTPTHWPATLENPNLSLYSTSEAIDFFQLAVTLLERAGVFKLENDPTPAKCRAAIATLKDTELQSFVLGLLQHQQDSLSLHV